jgi:holo-[acyl-carrier protein] synthase
MIVGIGIDIQAVSGVEQSLAEQGDPWLSVILTEREIEHLKTNSKGIDSIAGRLAAKEAAIKALEVVITDEVDWLDFEVINAGSGKPEIFINGNAKGKLDQLGATNVWLSIAHSEEYAVAQVILEARSMD